MKSTTSAMSTPFVTLRTGSSLFLTSPEGAGAAASAAGTSHAAVVSPGGVCGGALVSMSQWPSGKDLPILRHVDARLCRLGGGIDDPAASHRFVEVHHRKVGITLGDRVV